MSRLLKILKTERSVLRIPWCCQMQPDERRGCRLEYWGTFSVNMSWRSTTHLAWIWVTWLDNCLDWINQSEGSGSDSSASLPDLDTLAFTTVMDGAVLPCRNWAKHRDLKNPSWADQTRLDQASLMQAMVAQPHNSLVLLRSVDYVYVRPC